MSDIWTDAMSKKVVLAGPFSFTAILRMVRQAHDNFVYQKNIHKIVGHIKEFEKQFEMYNEEFGSMGRQIQTLSNTYQKVDSTRTRQLNRVVEKIKIESSIDDKPLLEKPIDTSTIH
jgi:DNA anti-recombination protein RmuC